MHGAETTALHSLFASKTVDDFVAVKAHDFNRVQSLSITRPQQVQQQSLGSHRILQVSITHGIWFGTRGSEVQILSPRPFNQGVRSGDIGNRTFRRHGLHFWPEGVLQGLQGFFLQINIAKIVIHKTD